MTKTAVILGCGASGLAAAEYLKRQGWSLSVADTREAPVGLARLRQIDESARFTGGSIPVSLLEGAGLVVMSPGLSPDHSEAAPLVAKARERGIPVIGEIELFARELARLKDERGYAPRIIGITGTNGKTTTKELIKAVLSEKYNVLATEGNFNNDVGVPKTLLRLTKEHEIAIIEMGASHPGDIKTLVETAEPTCGLITNVGRAHLQGFGSFEGVVKTKGELYDYLRTKEDGLVFINADNDYLVDMLTDDMWCTPYSTDPDNQYGCISGEVVSCDPLLKFRWRKPLMELEESGASQKWHKVQTNLIGSYNIDNLLAAIAVGINFGVDRKQIDHALENYVPTNNRSQLVETESNRLIVDAYNANPSSMMAALDNFHMVETKEGEEKMAILGDMRELGEASAEEHQKIVDLLAASGLENIWLVGEEFGKTHTDYRKFADVEAVKAELQQQKPQHKLILVKGSNGTKLYQLPELL